MKKLLIILSMMALLTHCTKIEFDGFDPTTATVRWIIKQNFDIVYCWGVLHHTGNMWKAIDNSTEFVSDTGLYYISIYVKNRFCGVWAKIKKTYTYGGFFIKKDKADPKMNPRASIAMIASEF